MQQLSPASHLEQRCAGVGQRIDVLTALRVLEGRELVGKGVKVFLKVLRIYTLLANSLNY